MGLQLRQYTVLFVVLFEYLGAKVAKKLYIIVATWQEDGKMEICIEALRGSDERLECDCDDTRLSLDRLQTLYAYDQVVVMKLAENRGAIERAMQSAHFPEWAKREIEASLNNGTVNTVRLKYIFREALEDMEDIIELSERKDAPDLVDWDEVKHKFFNHDEA